MKSMLQYYSTGMEPAIACNLNAIGAEQRARYRYLTERLRQGLRHEAELVEGYAYRLDTNTASLPELAEWITMEQLCCPFLSFGLAVKSGTEPQLTLTGPEGAKAILHQEFPGHR